MRTVDQRDGTRGIIHMYITGNLADELLLGTFDSPIANVSNLSSGSI